MSNTFLTIHDLSMENREWGDLIHVSFHVRDNRVLGLLGLDGSGIELLCRVMRGDSRVFEQARGRVWMCGREVTRAAELWSGVHYIRMADTTIENWTLAEYLGMSHIRLFIARRDKLAMQQRAEEQFRAFGRETGADRQMKELGELDRRIARIIRAMEDGARLLMIEDECLGMSPSEIREYAAVLHSVTEQGVPVVFRSQSVWLSETLCEELLVFRRGRLVKRWTRHEGAEQKEEQERLMQYLLGEAIAKEMKILRRTRRQLLPRRDITYQIQDLRIAGRKYRFRFQQGEVSALVVRHNLYCREFFDHLSGRKTAWSTRYFLGFRELYGRNQRTFIRSRIVSTVVGGGSDELFENMSIEDNLLMPSLSKFSTLRYFFQGGNLRRATRRLLPEGTGDEMRRNLRLVDQSGRIRIDMERWLMFRPRVLILYEPFAVCDAYGVSLITSYIRRFANIGTSVIIVKSNEEFLMDLADHIYHVET